MMSLCRAVLALCLTVGTGLGAVTELRPPDGLLSVSFEVKDFEGVPASPVYGIRHRDRTLINESRLALELEGGQAVRIVPATAGHHQTIR